MDEEVRRRNGSGMEEIVVKEEKIQQRLVRSLWELRRECVSRILKTFSRLTEFFFRLRREICFSLHSCCLASSNTKSSKKNVCASGDNWIIEKNSFVIIIGLEGPRFQILLCEVNFGFTMSAGEKNVQMWIQRESSCLENCQFNVKKICQNLILGGLNFYFWSAKVTVT